MERIALIGIMVENPASIPALNELLNEYAHYIRGRMGIPQAGGRINVISITLEAPADVINSLCGSLGRLDGVTAKSIFAREERNGE